MAAVLRGADAVISPAMPLLEAGECWLQQIARPDSGLSARTIADYSWTWQKYVDSTTSSLRGLTLQQANDPQRLLGAFNDVLRGGFGLFEYGEPISIVWNHSAKSRHDLGYDASATRHNRGNH